VVLKHDKTWKKSIYTKFSMYFSTYTSGVLTYYLIWFDLSTRFGTIVLFEYFFSEKFRKESSVFLTLKRLKHYRNLKTWILSVFYHKAFKDLFLEMFVRINFLLMFLLNFIQTSPIVMGDWPEEFEFSPRQPPTPLLSRPPQFFL